MKINKLRLHPFAGTRNRTIDFKGGLNVILGANEAGKSTLIKGLSCLFFTTPDLTQSKFDKELKDFLPLSGGDTIRISADIDLQGENYHLEKEFGAVKRAQLVLPTNAELNNIAEVQNQLKDKLGLTKASYEQVLITHQSDLAKTIAAFKKGDDENKLTDILRRKSYELDGVSVQTLRIEVDEKVKDYFNNWDENLNIPRDRKDFDNPHKNNIGIILKAYYTYRKLEKQLADAEQYEKEIDLVNAKLQHLSKQIEERQAFKIGHEPIIEDARKRKVLVAELDNFNKDRIVNSETLEMWPLEIYNLQEAVKNRESLTKEASIIKQKLDTLRKFKESEELRKIDEKSDILYNQYKAAEIAYKQLLPVTRDVVNEARTIRDILREKEIELSVKELHVVIKAKNNVSFGIKKGSDQLEEINLEGSQKSDFKAAGGLRIEHEDFIISVVSGQTDVKQLVKDIEAKKNELSFFFKKWNVNTLNELEELRLNYDKASSQLKSLVEDIKSLLKGRKRADIKQELASIVKPDISESYELLSSQYNDIQKELGKYSQKEVSAAQRINVWQKKYISKEELENKNFIVRSKILKIEEEINKLQPLPDNIIDIDQFINDFNKNNIELEQLQRNENQLKLDRSKLDKPEDSTEDLFYNLNLEKKEFENTLQKGKAYKRIQTELNIILDELDKDTFTPLKERTEYYFHKLTGGKYNTVKMQETIPAEIELNGTWLPENLLSTGTLDLLALATRLAMADFYLEDKSGFIVLDDPLVNLDPDRQEMAAKCLREIAEEKQVIVLTCHPSHAALLQGDLIEL